MGSHLAPDGHVGEQPRHRALGQENHRRRLFDILELVRSREAVCLFRGDLELGHQVGRNFEARNEPRQIVQLLLAENRHRLLGEGVDVFCVEEIKYSLLGRGCIVSGLCTLLCQLFVKRAEEDNTPKCCNESWGDSSWERDWVPPTCHQQHTPT